MSHTEQATYELANIDGLTLEQIEAELNNGGRFVIFQRRISLIVHGFQWLSRAYLIRSTEEVRSVALRYSLPTMLLGWWSLTGPVRTIQVLRFNLSGGVDVTDDIRANLTEESLKTGVVVFERIATIFSPVSRPNFQAIAGVPAGDWSRDLRGLWAIDEK